MAQKRRSHLVRRGHGVAPVTQQNWVPLDPRELRRRRWTWMISDLLVALLVMAASHLMRSDVALAQRIHAQTPPAVREALGYVILFATVSRVCEVMFSFKRVVQDDAYALRVFKLLAFWEAVRATAFLLLLMYGAGVIGEVASLLHQSATFLSARASYYVSAVVGWLISGVVGNFAYDFLKRLFLSRRSRSDRVARLRALTLKRR